MGANQLHWYSRLAGFLTSLALTAIAVAPVCAAPPPVGRTAGASGATLQACTTPGIIFTSVPAYGEEHEFLHGRVECLAADAYRVAAFIYVNGWYNKPTWRDPTVAIAPDGAWSADITTGVHDDQATQIAAFAVPASYSPPQRSGESQLPQELFDAAAAHVIVTREPVLRTISFSGYTWQVKESDSPVGPGDNYFSSREEDVFVDSDGYLHLRIARHDDRWYSSEVICDAPLEYGRYVFTLRGAVDTLDPNAVLGLFTWDGSAEAHTYREIDIEMSRWGEAEAPNAQYVIQPWQTPGNRHRFALSLPSSASASTHGFGWYPNEVYFQSMAGATAFPYPEERVLHAWKYPGPDVPPASGSGNAHINLWLLNGQAPLDGQPAEVIVQSFRFIPGASRDAEPAALFIPLIKGS